MIMALSAGDRLGRYEILGPLGAGGMGEVYRAHDERLDRDVAIKVLPEEVAQDESRLARFEREAKLLASLSHQNIATLYGLEEVELPATPSEDRDSSRDVILRSEATKNLGGGALSDRQAPLPDPSTRGAGAPLAQDDSPGVAASEGATRTIRFLVMELAEGETLAERIKKGAIPVDDALPIALQIAEGLEAAHEQGIIHRDLKPANVMLSPEGKVKILDFGLAKAWAPEESDADLTHSPTLTAQMTAAGVLLGTAAYMSPEQARGKPVDKRADIWAFGCVLWEMLTGERLFAGETVSDVLAAVLRQEPDLAELPPEVPQPLRRMLSRCLVKDPSLRLRDIGDARIVLCEMERGSEIVDLPTGIQPTPNRGHLWRWALIAFVAGLVVAALALSILLQPSEPAPQPVRRLSINLPADAPLEPAYVWRIQRPLALSPDGEWLVYVAGDESGTHLVKRRLDGLEVEAISGTQGSSSPFFSPDGHWVGFGVPLGGKTVDEPQLRKAPLAGGAPVDLCRVENLVLADWQEDGSIIFGAIPPAGIYRVPDGGGDPIPITLPDYESGEWYRLGPQLLPGGKGLLLIVGRAEGPALSVLSVGSGELHIVAEGVLAGRYVPSGHIVYPQQGRLVALPFDVATLTAAGDPVDVTEPGMGHDGRDSFEWDFSRDGTLIFAPVRTGLSGGRELVWKDRDGNEEPVGFPAPPLLDSARLSPDGRRLASGFIDPQSLNWDVRVYDLETGASTRFTFAPGYDGLPVWTPDGQRIVFASQRTGVQNLYWRDSHGIGEVERLTVSEYNQFPRSWSPDGKILFYVERGHPELKGELWALYLDEDPPRSTPLLRTPFNEYSPAISPDGRWLAYESDETGAWQVWVRPFPAMDRKWPVSIGGGWYPKWNPDGRSIFFGRPPSATLMEASIRTEPEFAVGRPQVVVHDPHAEGAHDVAPDGERFLWVKTPPQEDVTELIVVENWFEVLKQKAPPGRKR